MADTPEPAGRAARPHPDCERALAQAEVVRHTLDNAAAQIHEAYRHLHALVVLLKNLERRDL